MAAAAAAAFLRAERVSGPGEASSDAIVVDATSSTLLLPLDAAFDIAHVAPLRGGVRAFVLSAKGRKWPRRVDEKSGEPFLFLHPEESSIESLSSVLSLSSLFSLLALSFFSFPFSRQGRRTACRGSGESSSLSLSLSPSHALSPLSCPFRHRLPFCSGPLEEATEKEEESSEETQSRIDGVAQVPARGRSARVVSSRALPCGGICCGRDRRDLLLGVELGGGW